MGDFPWVCSRRNAEHYWVGHWAPQASASQHSQDIVRVRALGETDLNPVSGLGKVSQLLFAWIQPGNIVANIIAGGVAEAGAQQ